MKTLRICGMLIMAVLMSVSFTACGSDDDDDNNTTSSVDITGRWIQLHEIIDGEDNVTSYEADIWRFDANGAMWEYWLDKQTGKDKLTAKGSYSVNGNKLKIEINKEQHKEIWDGTFVMKNGEIDFKGTYTEEANGETFKGSFTVNLVKEP